jgi:hypothetical protein
VVWLSSSFLQLVLLPIIIVGQNIQAAMIQDHLTKQDELIARILGQIGPLTPKIS